MNNIKIQYEIHDVVSEKSSKVKQERKTPQRPYSAAITKSNAGYHEPNKAEYTRFSTNHTDSIPSTLPIRPRSAAQTKSHNPRFKSSDRPDWNVSLSVPDRDILIMEQDLEIDKYRRRHGYFREQEEYVPIPNLTDTSSRKFMKSSTSEEHRDRLEHYSFGAVVNDPLPFHPYLRNQTGIHGKRWLKDSKLPVEHEEWVKPNIKQNKSREAFHNEYHIKAASLPPQDINVQHSISSVVSSYSLAQKGSLKTRQHSGTSNS